MNRLVPIGTFAAMTRLSVRTLRRYDESGLLRAAEVDAETGYRYYSFDQVARAESIRLLRSMDASLDLIAAVIDADNDDRRRRVLAGHREWLRAERERHDAMLTRLDGLLAGAELFPPYDITTGTADDQAVLCIRNRATLGTSGEVVGTGFARVLAVASDKGGIPTAPPFVIFHDIIDDATDGDIEVCLPLAAAVDVNPPLACRTLSGGPFVAVTHRGPYDSLGSAYRALTAWMTAHGHSPSAPPREVYLNDPSTVEADGIETMVLWPI